ncbi:MAG: MFS transporter [Treponema sp.]|jgi:MFS family permease|nr:MFS transporter [Treponema sp.]
MSDNITQQRRKRPGFINTIYRSDAKVGRFLSVLAFYGVAYGLYRGIQDNYLAEIVHIAPFERGVVEFFRELPGLFLIFILALLYKLSDSKVFKIGLALTAAGLAGLLLTSSHDFFLTKVFVILFMVVYSAGEHIIMPVRSTIAMELAKEENLGSSLGIVSAIGQFGNIAGFLIVSAVFFVLSRLGFDRADAAGYRIVFGISTALMIATMMIAAAMKETRLKAPRQRFYFAKKFRKFYMLEVLYGARKQVFLTFAPYVLIVYYKADPSIMGILYAVCAVFTMIFSPAIGKLIDKLGYKIIMVADTLILIIVCLLYGFAHRLFSHEVAFIVVSVNFVLDAIISTASMANSVYIKDIAESQEEITATLSTGISVNHVFSVLIALLGGWIWTVSGIEVLFIMSAVLGLLNSLNAATIKTGKKVGA